jgi:hypothetical protein
MSHISSSLPPLGTLRVVPANHRIAPLPAFGMATKWDRVGAGSVANILRHAFWPPELLFSESHGIGHHTTKPFIRDVRTYFFTNADQLMCRMNNTVNSNVRVCSMLIRSELTWVTKHDRCATQQTSVLTAMEVRTKPPLPNGRPIGGSSGFFILLIPRMESLGGTSARFACIWSSASPDLMPPSCSAGIQGQGFGNMLRNED